MCGFRSFFFVLSHGRTSNSANDGIVCEFADISDKPVFRITSLLFFVVVKNNKADISEAVTHYSDQGDGQRHFNYIRNISLFNRKTGQKP